MASEKTCCVPGCGKSRSSDLPLHSFPSPVRDRERFIAWTQAVGPCVSTLEDGFVFKRRRACHDHFETKYLTWTRRLSPGAVPTLLIPACTSRAHNDATNRRSEHKTLPQECTQTADVFLFLDELFDSLNGSYDNSNKKSGKALLRAVTPMSNHRAVWSKAKPILKSMRFVQSNDKETTIPSINNWLRTINNIEYLTKILSSKFSLKSVWMRHFNQDPLENFFGSIRSHGCRNTNPTPASFESSFASLLITNLSGQQSIGSNCEDDTCQLIFKTMGELFKNASASASTELMHEQIDLDDVIYEAFEVKKNNPRILAQLQYVTGYLLKNTRKNVFKSCSMCKACLYDETCQSAFMKIREFIKGKCYLTYPSNSLVEAFSKLQDVVTHVLKTSPMMPNIKAYIKTIVYIDINFEFITCQEHKSGVVDYVIELSCRFFIFNWCKDVNRILFGVAKLEDHDRDDEVKVMAYNYYIKKKHYKNK